MLFLKPIAWNEVKQALQTWALCVAGIAITSVLLEVLTWGHGPYFRGGPRRVALGIPDIEQVSRVAGPFGGFAATGAVGALSVLLAVILLRRNRILVGVVGVGLLVASDSRTAYWALTLALLITTIAAVRTGLLCRLHGWVYTAALCGFIAYLTFLVLLDPSLNGRMEIWQTSVQLAPPRDTQNGLPTATGALGNTLTWSNDSLPPPGGTHNVLLDAVQSYGLAFSLCLLIFLMVLSLNSLALARVGSWQALALVVATVLPQATDVLWGMAGLTYVGIAMLLVSLLGAGNPLYASAQSD